MYGKRIIFFLPSFLFIILYWTLESNSPLRAAVAVIGLILMFGGDFLYKKFRSKEDVEQDKEVEKEIEKHSGKSLVERIAYLRESQREKKVETASIDKTEGIQASPSDKIRELSMLKDEGVISEDEFKEAKRKVMGL